MHQMLNIFSFTKTEFIAGLGSFVRYLSYAQQPRKETICKPHQYIAENKVIKIQLLV